MWFQEAKKGKDNEYRDYYIWRKPKYDADGKRQPPNNWGAVWGGKNSMSALTKIGSPANKLVQEAHGSTMRPLKSTIYIYLRLNSPILIGRTLK
jgi:glycosidase